MMNDAHARQQKLTSHFRMGAGICFFLSCLFILLLALIQNAYAETIVLEGNVSTRVESTEAGNSGPFEVEVAEGLSIRDDTRNKRIRLETCYPKSAGHFPVIVFSHGAVASARDYRPLAAYWASHGYVCVLPTHSDAASLNMQPGEKISVFKLAKLAGVNGSTVEQRCLDLTQTLDALPQLEQRVSGLTNKMDMAAIAIAGHHAGAFAAEVAGGAAVGRKTKSSGADQRVRAVIAITGKDWHQPNLDADDFVAVQLPMLMVSVNPDGGDLKGSRSRLLKAIERAPAGNKYMLTIDPVTKVQRPSLMQVRRAIKDSNVELVSFHPVRKRRFSFGRHAINKASNGLYNGDEIKTSDIDSAERVGTDLLKSLGLQSLLRNESGAKGKFNFVMSLTLPFLDAYLRGDKSSLEELSGQESRCFGDSIVARIERF
ncbi:MAG: hypothetical protein K2X93_19965 [Candidatus Obscuribacterales bacterium]|nr:hypothetical protein [Candidatus Obscuribacterales bacterium]